MAELIKFNAGGALSQPEVSVTLRAPTRGTVYAIMADSPDVLRAHITDVIMPVIVPHESARLLSVALPCGRRFESDTIPAVSVRCDCGCGNWFVKYRDEDVIRG